MSHARRWWSRGESLWARASVDSSARPRANRRAVPTCPACYKQSRKPEKFNYVYHRVLRRVGIGYFRCTHCDAYYFGFPWYEWGWFLRLRAMTRSWTRRVPVDRMCPNCGQSTIHRSHRQSIGEHLLSFFRISPYRCEECGHRFFAWKRNGDR